MTCKHYPNVGIFSEHYKDWEILETKGNTQIKRCKKCGQIDVIKLTSVNGESFLPEGIRYKREKTRDEHAIDMIQPIDQKTGKFNEEFGNRYGYNPLKTPAPIVNRPDDAMDRQMAGDSVDESSIKINKLSKQ